MPAIEWPFVLLGDRPFPTSLKRATDMHEMAIVTSIVDTVVDYATRANATQVTGITLVIGELHDVVDDLMESCFRYLARGTIAEGAALTLEKVPMRAQCTECALVYPADLRQRETLVCPDCGSEEFRIFNGNEFIIKNIEVR